MSDWTGRTVFVTGATSGFGAATARRFAAAGANLVLLARRKERLEESAKTLGTPVHVIARDIRDHEGVNAAIADLPGTFRNVDVLVNNAGLALGLGPAQEADWDDWEAMIETNVKGLVRLTRAILPGMVARKRGHVINLGSVAASYPYPGGNVYAGSKAFVRQFSLALRADLLGTRVRVSVLEPGMCETEFSMVRFKGDAEKAAKVYENMTPLAPDDIAESIFWVSSLPAHVNINAMEMMPVQQAFSPFSVSRDGKS